MNAKEHLSKAVALLSPDEFMLLIGEFIANDKRFISFRNMVESMGGVSAIAGELSVNQAKGNGKAVKAEALTVAFEEVTIEPRDLRFVHATIPADVALFRGTELIVAESNVSATGILCLLIGGKMQMPIPPNAMGERSVRYGATAQSRDIRLDTWKDGSFVFLVRNLSDKPVKWSARIEGRAVKRG